LSIEGIFCHLLSAKIFDFSKNIKGDRNHIFRKAD
jgi:hypothetical protein